MIQPHSPSLLFLFLFFLLPPHSPTAAVPHYIYDGRDTAAFLWVLCSGLRSLSDRICCPPPTRSWAERAPGDVGGCGCEGRGCARCAATRRGEEWFSFHGPSCCGVRCDIVPYMYKRYPSLAQLYYNCLLPVSWFRMN
ncbi:hypothetical protein B0H14DRAFT_1598995 [Mycena olivaceomarginata]|nr:hypothetical protein B0H14DRAFT_1598995 [Mycena olivaceomarginata]